MSKYSLRRDSSLGNDVSVGEPAPLRPSLFDHKDAFIERVGPLGMAAIYFGSFSLTPHDAPLSCQALFKLSFLHRHFLAPGGLRIAVHHQTATFSGNVTSRGLVTMAGILATQIEGIRQVKDETTGPQSNETAREAIQFLFATDQTLRSGVRLSSHEGRLTLGGEVGSAAQKAWAEQLVGAEVDSSLRVVDATPSLPAEPPQLDDESLQALVLFRLRLVRETEHLPVKVKANRGIVTLHGKVRTEALRQRVENLARSTLGLRELRSSLSLAP